MVAVGALLASVLSGLVPAADAFAGFGHAYLTEARVPDKSPAEGETLAEIEAVLDEADAQVVGLIRHDVRISAPGRGRKLRAGDIPVIRAEPEGEG